jgi:rSAM/selenodomain-associated transferase 1
MSAVRIILFAKAPVPGLVKTRLIPALGAEDAARLAAEMLARTIEAAFAAGAGPVELCADPPPDDPAWAGHLPGRRLHLSGQSEGGLGQRLARAARRAIDGGEAVLLIGTDCPGLTADRLRGAAAALASHDAVIHPTVDGGYALLGLRRFDPSLFERIEWSTARVAGQTLARLRALGWATWVGETLRDVDEPADLATLGRLP